MTFHDVLTNELYMLHRRRGFSLCIYIHLHTAYRYNMYVMLTQSPVHAAAERLQCHDNVSNDGMLHNRIRDITNEYTEWLRKISH